MQNERARVIEENDWTLEGDRKTCDRVLATNATRRLSTSERDLRRELDQSSRENGLRLQPGSARDERVVVCEHRAGVEGIVEIDSDHRTRAPEMQDFRSAEVELVDAISILLAGRKDVDRDVGRVAGRGAPQNLSDDLAWNSVVRRKERPGLALQDAAELYVDFRNDVGRERP